MCTGNATSVDGDLWEVNSANVTKEEGGEEEEEEEQVQADDDPEALPETEEDVRQVPTATKSCATAAKLNYSFKFPGIPGSTTRGVPSFFLLRVALRQDSQHPLQSAGARD